MNTIRQRSKFLQALGGAMLALATTCASAMIFSDKVDPNPDELIAFGANRSFTFMHSVVSDQDG
ncbi:MAG: hypothetical protein ABIO94_11080, partial [Opitutaceae bacterium]